MVHNYSQKMLPKATFVLGGAASGKSLWAENLLINSGLNLVYVATSEILDDETSSRIKLHQARRDARWTTIEAPLDAGLALESLSAETPVLIDCATMWLTNHMMAENDLEASQQALIGALRACRAPWVIVSNEVGHGIVPGNRLARQFREAQGRLNIALAAEAELAVMVVAGLPVLLKGTLP